MTGSGAWLPAREVAEAASSAMKDITICRIREKNALKSKIEKRTSLLGWFWRGANIVSREDLDRVSLLENLLDNPMEDDEFYALCVLAALAENAAAIWDEAQVFVSAEDNYRIYSALSRRLSC